MKGRGLDLPRPFRAGAPLAACAAVAAVLVGTGFLSVHVGLALAAVCAAAGGLRALLAHMRLAGLRRQADRELRRSPSASLRSSLADWRAGELTAPRARRERARSLLGAVRDLSPARLPGPSPLNRVAVRPHAELLLQLAARTAALGQPVTPYGMLLIDDLLTSPDSPLYARERAAQTGRSIRACLDALDSTPSETELRLAS